jgi:replicative DNA helicase
MISALRRKQSVLHSEPSTGAASGIASWKLYACRPEALSPAKDPDEFVRTHGTEAFQALLQREIYSADRFAARFIAEQYGGIQTSIQDDEANTHATTWNDTNRDKALERLWQYAQYLHSPFQTQDLVQEFSTATGLSVDILQTAQTLALEHQRREHERNRLARVLAEADGSLRRGETTDEVQYRLRTALQGIEASTAQELPRYTLQQFLSEIRTMPEGLQTGYPELDEHLRLSQNGITIIAARPSHGKTSMKMNLLLNLLAQHPDRTFVFFSYEEPVKIITLKLLNILAGVRFQGQQLPDLTAYLRQQTAHHEASSGIAALEEAKHTLGGYLESGRLVLSGERYTSHEIKSVIHRLKNSAQHFAQNLVQHALQKNSFNIGGVFVDYVQKIKPHGKFTTRQLELQHVSADLHSIAVEHNIPVIVGAQFNREVRTESDIREDCLREAGDLEQDANVVLALWNPAKANTEETSLHLASVAAQDPRRVELNVKILKNRDGAVHLKGVPLLYDMPLSTIRSFR